jgi:pectinesterase
VEAYLVAGAMYLVSLSPAIATLALIVTPIQAANRTSAPPGCLVVSSTASRGSSGSEFTSLQAAVNSLASGASASSTTQQCIFIQPGRYSGQVHVQSNLRAPLTIYGSTPDSTSWRANTVTLVNSLSQASPGGLSNDETGTLRARSGGGIKVYNVDIVNGYGKGSQAIALSAQTDGGFYGCSFIGFQDTLLANKGNQVYAGCRIRGATDFVFGTDAGAWFEKCDVEVVAANTGYITGKKPRTSR